jgi:prepilin-type N-terminal cleavage/methylation domain-containing protein
MSNMNNVNPLKSFSKKRAFSLIELSIVLIIIGLLIAGITGGASLIKSASLRAAMGEARGYNVAVNSFYVQFDALPGDYATIISGSPTASVGGDSNGHIDFVNGISGTPATAENANAWAALKNSGVIDTVLSYVPATLTVATGVPVASQVPGISIPASKIKSAGWVFDYVGTQNVVILTQATTTTANRAINTVLAAPVVGAVTPSDGLSIDTKMDDGVGTTGRVRGTAPTPANCRDVTTGVYVTATTTAACALTFQVDIT